MKDNLQRVYATLKNEGYDLPEYDVFANDMRDDDNLSEVRESLVRAGYTPPEFNVFKVDMFGEPVKEQEQPKGGENGYTFTAGELGLNEEPKKESRIRQKWEAQKAERNKEDEDGTAEFNLTDEGREQMAQRLQEKTNSLMSNAQNASPNLDYGSNAKYQKEQKKKQQKVEAEQKVETIEAVRTDFSELDDASKVKTLERMFGKSINEIEDDFLAATDRRVNGDYDLLFRWATGGNLKANELTMDAVVDKRTIAGKSGYTPAQIEAGVADDDTTMKYMADKQMAELEEGLDSIEAEIKAKAGEVQANWEKEKPAGWDIAMALSTTDQRGMTSADAVRDAMSINGIPTEEAQEVVRQLDMINYTRQNIAKAKNLQALAQAEGGGGKQFVAGMGAAILDPDTWTSAEEIKRGQALQGVLDKINDEGEGSLTQAEQKFLESVVMLTAYNEMYAEDVSASAGAGKSFMESIPFMFEMAINPLRGTGKAAGKKLLKWAEKRFRSNVLKKGTQVLGNIAGSVAAGYGTAATMQLPGTIAGVQERMQGDVVVDTDEDGKLVYGGQKNEKGAATAVYEEFTERMLDTASEMIGAGYASLPFRQLRKWGKGTKVLGWIDNLANSRFGKTLGNFFERTGWHGPIEEFMEEVHVGLLSPALLKDPKLKDFFNEKDLTTTLIAVAVPGAITSSLRTAVGAYDGSFKLGAQEKWKMQSADRTARTLWGENTAQWDEIKSRLDNGSIENTEETLSEIDQAIKDVYADETLTNEQKKAALQYAVYSLQYKTAIGVSEAITDERQKMLNEMLNGRYEEGYNTDPDTVNGSTIALANKSLDDAETAVRVALGLQNDASIEDFVGGRSVDEVAMGDEAVADALYTYLEEKAKVEGMRDRFNEQRDSEIAEADNSVDAVAHEDGNVYMTTLSSTGEVIYITGGTVVLDNDGYIDVNQSEGLVALMPNSKKEAIQPGQIRDKVTVENVEAQKAAKRAEIDARYESQLNTFVYSDSEGDHTVMLVGRRGDMVDALIDGRPTEVPAKEFEAIMADATGKQPVVEGGEVKAEGATSGDVVSPVETTQPIEQPGLSNGLSNETAQTETVQPQVVAPVESQPIPMEKRGKEERAAYHMVPIERTMEDLDANELTQEEKEQFTQANIDEITKDIEALDKKEPKMGANIQAYKTAKQQWQSTRGELQARLDYYNALMDRLKQPIVEVAAVEQTAEQPAVESVPVAEQAAEVAPTQVESTPVAEQTAVEETPQATNEMQPVQEESGSSEIPNSSTVSQASEQVIDHYALNSAGNSTQMLKDMEAVRKSNREEYGKISPAYELFYKAKERGLYPNELEELRAIVKGTSLESKVDGWFTPVMAEGEPVGQSGVAASEGNSLANAVLEKAVEKQKKNLNDRIREAVTKGRIKQWEKRTGISVRVVESIDEVTNRQARAALEAGQIVKGWIDGNEVVIYLPNIESVEDVDKTYIHEVVAHKGLKILMGKDFDKLCDKVWEMMSEEQRREYLAYIGANLENPTQADMRDAADEYMAYLAESVELTETEKGIWQKIVDAIREFLLGEGVKLTDKDIENLIRASYANLASGNTKGGNGGTMFRLASSNASAIKYDKMNGTNVKEFFDFLRGGMVFEKGKPNVFHIANAGNLLEQYGIKGKFMVGQFTFSRTHTQNEDHNLGIKEWVDVINNLNNPLAITSYKGLPNEYRIYTYATVNGKNICVGVNVSLKDGEIELSRIISAYGRDINNLLGKEGVNLLYPDMNELKRRISQGSTAHNSLLNATSTASADKDNTGFAKKQGNGTKFRKVNENQEIFVSNARKAVEEIKQEKATPQQWLAMIKKNGGLKAGEDAWMGFSEWLENSESKSLTKQEVLDFVNENAIKIEEVRYAEEQMLSPNSILNLESTVKLALSRGESIEDGLNSWDDEFGDNMLEAYKNGAIRIDEEGNVTTSENLAFPINETRENYTTDGLENKREIALVVPTIEPYNQSDEIHFGDAGEGRAVAWVRFGETTDSEGNRVLVIDEIQSKRHQDGRDKGYRAPNAMAEYYNAEDALRAAIKEKNAYRESLKEKYGFADFKGSMLERARWFSNVITQDEALRLGELQQKVDEAETVFHNARQKSNGVPAAPFEKNWQELAMKRMLRLAAEEGFDKVAWTTGEQQAERYNLSKAFNDIEREDNPNIDGRRFVLNGANVDTFQVDENGNIIDSTLAEAKGKPLADVVGKDMAIKMMSLENGDMLEGEDLRIGGEGMKGFYDKMLPSFVSKYTKKWGAKVGEVEMPNLEQNNVMHSVDVTPEMKESVMEGQTMFRFIGKKGAEKDGSIENKNITLHKTKDGKVIKYEQLDLFNTDERTTTDIQRGASGGIRAADNGTGTDDLQREGYSGGDTLTLINAPLRPLEEGETSLVQRVFTKSKAFDFTAGEQIESLEDVAYIFKNLEDESIENTFAVLVKDGKPVVLHLGMGNYTTSIINASAVAVAMENVKPDKVYLVHNHPSGALSASDDDVAALEGFRTIYGDIVEKGIIINLKSGKFGIYDTAKETSEERSTKAEGGADVPVETFTFNKQVFDKDFNPAELFQVKNDSDVAAFISSNRLGDRNKIGLLVCNNQNRVVGNVFTPFVGITAASAKKVAKEIVYYTTVMGGNRPVLFGRFPALSAAAKSNLGAYIGLYSGGTIKLLDMVDVESRESVLHEDEMVYGDKSVDNSLNVQEERTLFSKKELTPEQKAKQEALKENAKAIRRLHNVTSRYPITALRNLGFALETQEQREMHDRLFAERDAITGESMPAGLQTNPQAMTLQERITESLLKHAEQEKENVEMRLSAIRAYGRDLANVIKLMNAQKGYDKRTVRIFTDLVKMYMRNNAMKGMSSYKIIRLLNLMQKATGGYAKTVNRAAVKIAEIITSEHTSQLKEIMEKQMKTGAERVNASGVVVQGGVDIIGKRILNTYKSAIELEDKDFEQKYNDAFKKVGEIQKLIEQNGSNKTLENQLAEAQAEADAMLLAATYRNEVKAAEADITKIKDELTGKRTKAEKGEITWKEYHEFAKTINSQIVQLRAQQIDAYQKVLHALSGDIYEGVQRARAFREAEAMRVQRIHDMAENDMNGVDKSAERKEPGVAGKTVDMVVYKNPGVRLVMNGLGTYENYMKYFGRDHLDGRGELFNHFMTAFTEAQNKEWKESQNDFNILEAAARDIFGKKLIGKTYMSIARDSTKGSGVILKYWNGGAVVERELTIGQLMYLYMTEKQTEGQMKLRNMGLTEEKVKAAVEQLPAKYKKFADFVQSKFLPQMRPRMNEVHQRMFGASMSEVENYFPLKVNKDARQGNDDINNTSDAIPSTITGSVIKRRVNVTPIDLTANAFDVLNEHIVEMEHWAAYAEFIRDNNTLINDKDFKNRVQNTKSVRYGDGKTLWDNFVDTARIATGNYKAKHDYLTKLMRGANASKITFGYYTALKQLASAPAFWSDAKIWDAVWYSMNPMSSWKWAMENLPGFEERVKSRTAGNERLGGDEYSIHDSRIIKAARNVGMAPNAFVDAVVVASGARAVYKDRLNFYKKLGMTDYEANRRAKNDAAISYNETQQSGQGAYLSTLQREGGLGALLTTLFRNSQMAFQRRVVGSMVEVGKKLARGEKIREATKQKYIKMGMSEEAAEKQANRDFYKAYAKDFTNLAIFGYGMNYVWALMGELPYLLFGDDEEEKEKIWENASKMGVTGTFEGFTLGNVAKGFYERGVNGGKYRVGIFEAPFETDLMTVLDRFEKDGTLAGIMQLATFMVEMNTGISPQRLIDDVAAWVNRSNGDVDTATKALLLALRWMKVPQSQQDKLILDEADGADAEELKRLAEWYINYKMKRNFPLGSENEKRVDKYANKFVETLKERVEKEYSPEDISVIFDQSSDTEKEILKKKWIEGMDERNGTNVAKSLRKEKLEELLGSPVENAAQKALHKYSKVNTYEKLETFEDLERWYEYKVLHDKFKSDYEKIRDGEELSPEERAKAVEHYGVYADKGFKEVINAIGAHKKFIKQNKDPEWRMSEVRRLTDIATEIMKRYE